MSKTDMSDTEKFKQLYSKILTVKKQMGAVSKSSNNPFFNSKYADLNSHLKAVEPLLQEAGLVLTQPVVAANSQNGYVNVVQTQITDSETGTNISSSFSIPGNITDMQKLGAAITYARRYTLGSILSMQAEDDDANSVVGKVAKKATKASSVRADF